MGAIENYAEACYENLPSKTGDKPPWFEISEERKDHFRALARNLGSVFPQSYPAIATELRQTADDNQRAYMYARELNPPDRVGVPTERIEFALRVIQGERERAVRLKEDS